MAKMSALGITVDSTAGMKVGFADPAGGDAFLAELKRVIAAYGDRVVMEETLGAALAALFKETAPLPVRPGEAGAAGPAGPADARAREALAHYDRAIERLKAGDFAGFGAELDALRPLLEALGRPTRGP
jgi:uncharacterized membrane protein (UPF0182 family)